jgi:hypothetical protein
MSWQFDPLTVEQGAYNDEKCENKRAFICQSFGQTIRYEMMIINATMINESTIVGGAIYATGMTIIDSVTLYRSAKMIIAYNKGISFINGQILLYDGSALLIHSTVHLRGGAIIGEQTSGTYSDSYSAVQSVVTVLSNGHLYVTCSSYTIVSTSGTGVGGTGGTGVATASVSTTSISTTSTTSTKECIASNVTIYAALIVNGKLSIDNATSLYCMQVNILSSIY